MPSISNNVCVGPWLMISASTALLWRLLSFKCHFRQLNHKLPFGSSQQAFTEHLCPEDCNCHCLEPIILGTSRSLDSAENTANLCNQTHLDTIVFLTISVEPFPFTSRRQECQVTLGLDCRVGIIHQKSPSSTSIIAPREHRTLSSKAGNTACQHSLQK